MKLNSTMNPITLLLNWFKSFRKTRALKKRLAELRKRDPFIY